MMAKHGDRWLFSGMDERLEHAGAFESSTEADASKSPCETCADGMRLSAFARRRPTEAIVCRFCKRGRQGNRYGEYTALDREQNARDGLDMLYSLGALALCLMLAGCTFESSKRTVYCCDPVDAGGVEEKCAIRPVMYRTVIGAEHFASEKSVCAEFGLEPYR